MRDAKAARYPRFHQSTVVPRRKLRPSSAEKGIGFTFEIACIHGGKEELGNSAALANMSGMVMKFATTPGVCQSVAGAVTARKRLENPNASRNSAAIQPTHSIGESGNETPKTRAATIMTGT